ncbi:MAG: LysE family transporter [Bacteroidia bacterium]|nr:LysE family transporter [Bacteroidia bacterium]
MVFILKGLIIGIIVSIPIGPIFMLTVQKSVNDGKKAGFSCGLGATAVDTMCAIISAFALSAIGQVIQEHTAMIEIIGGMFITCVGANMLRMKIQEQRRKKPYSPKNFIKALTMGSSNPAALAVMLAVFTFFKMDMSDQPAYIPVMAIMAVAAGSAAYWYIISMALARLGDRFNFKILVIVNRIAAVAIMLFGLFLIYKGITA